jgi:hypothetical protein
MFVFYYSFKFSFGFTKVASGDDFVALFVLLKNSTDNVIDWKTKKKIIKNSMKSGEISYYIFFVTVFSFFSIVSLIIS